MYSNKLKIKAEARINDQIAKLCEKIIQIGYSSLANTTNMDNTVRNAFMRTRTK